MSAMKWLGIIVFLALTVIFIITVQNQSEKIPSLKTSRLLVNVQSSAGFSPQEFAEAASAKLVLVDPRNPFKSVHQFFSEYPFIVVSPELDENTLSSLAKRYGYRYISFSQQTVKEAVDQSKNYLASIPKFSSEITYLNKKSSQEIYDLMRKIDSLLTQNHIKYWATAGTLLGAIRHGGLIPWDDDLDICILDIDEKKFEEMKQPLEQLGLVLHYYRKDFYKIYKKDGDPIPDAKNPGENLPFKYPFADVFIVTLEKNKEHEDVYVHRSNNFYFLFNNERYSYSQIATLSRVPFGPMTIPIPENPEKFLNSAYGMANHPRLWTKYAIEPVWDHQAEKSASIKGAAFVEIDDYLPAPY